MDYVLRTNALCKKYKDFKALNGTAVLDYSQRSYPEK